MKFEEFNLHEDILHGISDAGFKETMPAQERTLEAVLSGKDVTVQSQTGTGKTAAFLITIYQLFKSDAIENKKALIVVPTRELAVQIEEEADVLGKYLDYKTTSIYGGVGYEKQLRKLKDGSDLIIGTPGRLLDLEKSNNIDYKDFGVLVIDEADRLFDMGFFPDLRKMLRKLVSPEKRRTMLFSATLNTRVLNLAWDQMNEYEEIKIKPENITVQEITQELYHVAGQEKFRLLLGILKKEHFENAMVFCNTKFKVEEVSKRLQLNGYKTKYLMGDLPQKKRLSVINDMKAGKLEVLVATDVAARGLHVDDLSLVVNFDLPEDYENYVHRIGRTARAGKSGKAISLACEKYVYHLEAIESFIDNKITVMTAGDELFEEDKSKGMKFRNERREETNEVKTNKYRKNQKNSGNRRNENKETGRTRHSNQNSQRQKAPIDRKNIKRNDSPRSVVKKNIKRPVATAGVEERLDYYREKYGENFIPPEEIKKSAKPDKNSNKYSKTAKSANEENKKQGFFKKLFGRK